MQSPVQSPAMAKNEAMSGAMAAWVAGFSLSVLIFHGDLVEIQWDLKNLHGDVTNQQYEN